MKLNQIITGCALAAGLMAFAPQSQAGVVIDNSIYAPASFKLTYSYVDAKGKAQKVSFVNKDILSYWDYPKGTWLAYGPDNDIYVISKDNVVLYDVTFGGFLYVDTSEYSSQQINGKNGAYKYYETGLVDVGLYSERNSLGDNYYDFEVSGTYSVKYSQTAESKKFIYSVNESFTMSNLTGEGDDNDLTSDYYPVSGTASASGSGKLTSPE